MHVRFETTEPGVARIEVDGVDITSAVMRRGFFIHFDERDPLGRPYVSLTLRPERLTVDGECVITEAHAERAELTAAVDATTERIAEADAALLQLQAAIAALPLHVASAFSDDPTPPAAPEEQS